MSAAINRMKGHCMELKGTVWLMKKRMSILTTDLITSLNRRHESHQRFPQRARVIMARLDGSVSGNGLSIDVQKCVGAIRYMFHTGQFYEANDQRDNDSEDNPLRLALHYDSVLERYEGEVLDEVNEPQFVIQVAAELVHPKPAMLKLAFPTLFPLGRRSGKGHGKFGDFARHCLNRIDGGPGRKQRFVLALYDTMVRKEMINSAFWLAMRSPNIVQVLVDDEQANVESLQAVLAEEVAAGQVGGRVLATAQQHNA